MASKPPQCGPNYHLASDRLVITGARGWKEKKREEERGGRAPHPNTYPSVPPSLGALSGLQGEAGGRWEGWMAETDAEGLGHTDTSWQSRPTQSQPGHCRGLMCIPE